MSHLLPPNASPLQRAFSLVGKRHIEAVPHLHRALWDPWTCPAPVLPWLAWALSVDDWIPAWPEATRRQAVADAALLHRRKGTPWAVKHSLQRLGFQDVEILEATNRRHDGAYSHDGAITYGVDLGPYQFDILLNIATATGVGTDLLYFGGDAWGLGAVVVDGGTAAAGGEVLVFGGLATGPIFTISDLTPALEAEIRRRVSVYKNERSKLRNLYTYQLYHDGTHDYTGDDVYHDGGMLT